MITHWLCEISDLVTEATATETLLTEAVEIRATSAIPSSSPKRRKASASSSRRDIKKGELLLVEEPAIVSNLLLESDFKMSDFDGFSDPVEKFPDL